MLASGAGHGLAFAGNLTKVTVDTPSAERGAVLGTVYFVNSATSYDSRSTLTCR
jgi:hypothetical protein